MAFERHLTKQLGLFKNKIIFISGPRQAGKTFLITHCLKPDFELNMDVASERLRFKKMPEEIINWYERSIGPFPKKENLSPKPLVFIDEIHKVKGWRNLMKGTYDKTHHVINYVASGSSAFELRKQDKGDSLAGRAVWFTLFPLSFREYVQSMAPEIDLAPAWKGKGLLREAIRSNFKHQKNLRGLWNIYAQHGSYPENLLQQNEIFLKQWLTDYQAAMLDRDLRDLNLGKDVERVYRVYELLLEGMGSTYSINSLAQTLGVSPNTIKSDIRALQQVLWGYDIPVCQISKAKQIRKEKKFYPMDFCFARYQTPLMEGAPFESTVACLLYRGLWPEISGFLPHFKLGFYRDYQQHEIDFVLRDKKSIAIAIECKLKVKHGTGHLPYFEKHFKPTESLLVIEEENIFSVNDKITSVSIEVFASCLE